MPQPALQKWVQRCGLAEQMERVDVCEACSHEHAAGETNWGRVVGRHVGPTLSVSGMSRVDVEGLLTLSDGGGQGQVGLHHPLLVVAIDDRLGGHGQRVALGHVLGQRGERLLGLQWADRHVQSVSDKMQWLC